MFYPGDPNEERKRRLVEQLMRGQRGGADAGFGQKLGHMAGMFGRGFGGFAGAPGMARASGRMPQLPGQAAPQAQQAPPFQMIPGPQPQPGQTQTPFYGGLIQSMMQQQNPFYSQAALSGYGMQPRSLGGMWQAQ